MSGLHPIPPHANILLETPKNNLHVGCQGGLVTTPQIDRPSQSRYSVVSQRLLSDTTRLPLLINLCVIMACSTVSPNHINASSLSKTLSRPLWIAM